MMERMKIEGAQVSEIPDGAATIVVSIQHHIKSDQRQRFKELVQGAFPGRNLFIAEGGMTVSEVGRSAQLDRIEAKLDALLGALVEEGPDEEPQYDLDGNLIEGGERDETQSLD
jgi:hypothetical protein